MSSTESRGIRGGSVGRRTSIERKTLNQQKNIEHPTKRRKSDMVISPTTKGTFRFDSKIYDVENIGGLDIPH